MESTLTTFGVFADESRHTEGRFRCIAAVSLPADDVETMSDRLREPLKDAGLQEFKWRDLRRSGPRRGCALRFVDALVEAAVAEALRADILVWDTDDARHSVDDRDDFANYERMFYHLHRHLIGQREGGAEWHLRPDEQVNFDWDTLASCLGADGTWKRPPNDSVLIGGFGDLLPRIRTMKQVDSKETPLCQLADLLAGIAPYTRERADLMRHLSAEEAGQERLFGDATPPAPSARDRARFPVIRRLADLSRRHRLGASFDDRGYFRSYDPRSPLNFWHYESRSIHDRAPSREQADQRGTVSATSPPVRRSNLDTDEPHERSN